MQKGRFGVQGGEQGAFHHRHIGGEKDPFQFIFSIEGFGQPEDLQVVFRGGTDDHLGALAGGDELGRMAIADQIGGVFLNPGADLAHRG